MRNLIILFNHTLTNEQELEAKNDLLVSDFLYPNQDVRSLWSSIPADSEKLSDYLENVKKWLFETAKKDDYVLIQGDFGATYILVQFAFNLGLIPIYSTTKRVVQEEKCESGEVKISRVFKHVMFRKYEKV